MASLLKTIFPCFPIGTASTEDGSIKLPTEKAPSEHISEKPFSNNPSYHNLTSPTLHTDEAASQILSAMLTATHINTLAIQIQSLVHQAGGWSEYLATKILTSFEAALKAGKGLSPLMQEAYDKACEAAKVFEQFEADHPIVTAVFCTVIAIGILAYLAPGVLGILGFGELGPIEGTWAAAWQARYAGLVPKGSLFSFFQRLGMIWK